MSSTTVTGTIIDIQGVPWINAPIKITFVPNPSKPGPVIWTDGPFNAGPITIFTDGSAKFSIILPSTTSIQPSNSTWLFCIGPNASAQSVDFNIGVTGITMDITALFTAKSNALLIQSLRIPRAYEAFQLDTPVNEGQLWWNTTQRVFQFWDGSVWNQILGTIPPTNPSAILPNPTTPQAIVQPPNTNMTITTSGTGVFQVSGVSDFNGLLTVSGLIMGLQKIKAYGFTGTDLTASNTSIGVGVDSVTPTFSLINVTAPLDQKITLFAATPTQFFISATADSGTDHGWFLATRNGTVITLLEIKAPVQIDGALSANGFPVLSTGNFVLTTLGNAGPSTLSTVGGTTTLNIPTYAGAGGGSVTQIVAGANINISPPGGTGVVTISAPGAGAQIYPPAGVGVSTGIAWGPSIDPALIPLTNKNNTFTVAQTFGSINAGTAVFSGAVNAATVTATSFVNAATLNISGTTNLGSVMNLLSLPSRAVFTSNSGTLFIDSYGPDTVTSGIFQLRTVHSDGSGNITALNIAGNGNAVLLGSANMQYLIVKGFGAFGTAADYPDNSAFLDWTPVTGIARLWARTATTGYASIQLEGAPNNATGAGITYLNCHALAGNAPVVDLNCPLRIMNGATVEAEIDQSGAATFSGTIKAFSSISVSGGPGSASLGVNSNVAYHDCHGVDAATIGSHTFRVLNSDESTLINALHLDTAGNAIFNSYVQSGSSLFVGANIFQVTALNTNTTIPLSGFNVCLWCARDNTLGGSALILLDPNAGPVVLSNQITGLVPPQFIGGSNTWAIQLTSGPAPRNIAWVGLIL